MFSKEFTFIDYKGNEKKATYWFSLEKDEMLKRELGTQGGLENTLKRLLKEERPDKVLDMLEDIVLSAVGEVSSDGESFYKSPEISNKFKQTKVCHDLLFELLSNENALRDFLLGAIPADLAAKMTQEASSGEDGNVVKLPDASN